MSAQTKENAASISEDKHKELIKKTGLRDRTVKFGNFHVLRENKQPSILLELGFLSNPQEERLVRTHAYQVTASNAVYSGLESYFGNWIVL